MTSILLPLLLLFVAGVYRIVSIKKFSILYDEQITRAVVENIWRGDLRNDWANVPNIPEAFHLHCYNFSSYFYADALAVGPKAKHPLFRERLFSAICGIVALIFFYLFARGLFGQRVALSALAIMAVFPLLVQDAHYARPEAFALMLCGALYLSCLGLLKNWRPQIMLAGSAFIGGLLIACKVSFIPMAMLPIACAFVNGMRRKQTVALWGALLVLGTFAGVPDAFIHPAHFIAGLKMLRHQYANEHVPHSLPDSLHCWGLLIPYFRQTAGIGICALAFCGAGVLFARKRYIEFGLLAAPLFFYVLVFGQQRVFFERNLSHVIPLAAILCGVSLASFTVFIRHRTWRDVVMSSLLALALVVPVSVSSTLVFRAMRTVTDWRAAQYTRHLRERYNLIIAPGSELLGSGGVTQLVATARRSAMNSLVLTNDYHDAYTRQNLKALQQQVDAVVVGKFPSFFPGFAPSTLMVYHSPALRYLRLSPPSSYEFQGNHFVSWQLVANILRPAEIEQQSWRKDGLPSSAPRLPGGQERYGSYVRAHHDANRGRLEMRGINVHQAEKIGLPFMTGSLQTGLSIKVTNHETGHVLAELNPVPSAVWMVWRVEIEKQVKAVDVVATDNGQLDGEWLAVGFPHQLVNR